MPKERQKKIPIRFVGVLTKVNPHQIAQYTHGPGDSGEVQLKGRSEKLPVSRSYLHLFRQM